jgi:hypothetical protein
MLTSPQLPSAPPRPSTPPQIPGPRPLGLDVLAGGAGNDTLDGGAGAHESGDYVIEARVGRVPRYDMGKPGVPEVRFLCRPPQGATGAC